MLKSFAYQDGLSLTFIRSNAVIIPFTPLCPGTSHASKFCMSRSILTLTLLLQMMILPEAYGQRLKQQRLNQQRQPQSSREVVHVDFNRNPSFHVQVEPLGRAVKKSEGDARRTAPQRARQVKRTGNRPIQVRANEGSVIVADRQKKKAQPVFEVEEAPLSLDDALRSFRAVPKSK